MCTNEYDRWISNAAIATYHNTSLGENQPNRYKNFLGTRNSLLVWFETNRIADRQGKG